MPIIYTGANGCRCKCWFVGFRKKHFARAPPPLPEKSLLMSRRVLPLKPVAATGITSWHLRIFGWEESGKSPEKERSCDGLSLTSTRETSVISCSVIRVLFSITKCILTPQSQCSTCYIYPMVHSLAPCLPKALR